MKTKVYLIRHGHTAGTDAGLMYGATELPVTEEGLAEIREKAAAGIYPDPDGAALYTSGMLRAEQSFEAIYGDAEHSVAPLIREINLGRFEMMTIDEIAEDEYGRQWLSGKIKDPHFEGGDSVSGFFERTQRGMREIVDECFEKLIERAIVVFHGAAISSIMYGLFPDTYDNSLEWTPSPGNGIAVTFEDKRPVSWEYIGESDNEWIRDLKGRSEE